MSRYKRFLKRSIIFLMVFAVLWAPITENAHASYDPFYYNDAIRLNRLGLFLGTGSGFDLDKPIDRLQGAVLFIRLVGEEEEALSTSSSFPFSDVTQAWAKPYVGHMFAEGYSNGISESQYGTGPMTGNQFATYILRALGYSDADGDFTWDAALSKLLDLEILSLRDYEIINQGTFYRDHAVKLASAALDARINDSDATLYEKLYDEGSIKNYSTLIPPLVPFGTQVRSYEDMTAVFQAMRANLQYSCTLDTRSLSLEEIRKWLNDITNTASADVWGWNIVSTYSTDKNYPEKVSLRWVYSDGYEVAYSYMYPDSDKVLSDKNQQIKQVVDEFLEEKISSSMSARDKIKAVHDFLVLGSRYDTDLVINSNTTSDTASDSYSVYGVLINGLAVCDGYSKAFNMFMDILGIPSDRVVGLSEQDGQMLSHAWNRVYLDGEYHFIDVTWDDPVPDKRNRILYNYYLVPEEVLQRDHVWEESQFDIKYF